MKTGIACLTAGLLLSPPASAEKDAAKRRAPPAVPAAEVAEAVEAAELPAEARDVVEAYQAEKRAIERRIRKQLRPHQLEAVQRLRALQDDYTRRADLDGALAVRVAIYELLQIRDDPGVLHLDAADIGRRLTFLVTGKRASNIWGSDVYTGDSHLGGVCVHAGLLEPGERGVVTVDVLAGRQRYASTTRHGITSQSYGPWSVSFEVRRDRHLEELILPQPR